MGSTFFHVCYHRLTFVYSIWALRHFSAIHGLAKHIMATDLMKATYLSAFGHNLMSDYWKSF